MNVQTDETNEQVKFVYLESNKQKVSHLVSNFNRVSIFTLTYSIFFAIYQIEKHIAIYFEHQNSPDPLTNEHEIQMYSFNLHTFYAFMTLFVSIYIVYKAWRIKKEPNFIQFGLESFRREFHKIEDYIYLNLLLVLFCLIRFFEAGFLHVWLDLVSSVVGLILGKLLQKQRSDILLYSTELKQQSTA